MAKHSKQDIFDTADQLVTDGKNPTLANVREALGGGSFTTISQAMNEWKAKQAVDNQTIKEAAPEAITSRIGELSAEIWAVAQEMANARLNNEREALEHSRLDMEASQKEAIDLADQLSADLDSLQTKYDQMVDDVRDANELLDTKQRTNLELQKQLDAATIRTEENNNRMQDLRDELKHAHEGERAQREQHNREIKQLNEKLSAAQQTGSDERAAAARLEGELKHSQAEIQSQREQYTQAVSDFDKKITASQQAISDNREIIINLENDLKNTQKEAKTEKEQHTKATEKLNKKLVDAQTIAGDERSNAARLSKELETLQAQNKKQ